MIASKTLRTTPLWRIHFPHLPIESRASSIDSEERYQTILLYFFKGKNHTTSPLLSSITTRLALTLDLRANTCAVPLVEHPDVHRISRRARVQFTTNQYDYHVTRSIATEQLPPLFNNGISRSTSLRRENKTPLRKLNTDQWVYYSTWSSSSRFSASSSSSGCFSRPR